MRKKIEYLLSNLNNKLEGNFLKMQEKSIAEYANKIVSNANIVPILEQDKLEAFIAFYDNDPKKEIAYLSMLAVDYGSLGKSYGKVLMETAINILRKKGFRYFDIDIDVDNSIAIDFAKRYGFKIMERGEKIRVRRVL
ncbi:ribosomal-protein-alanine N-acetyltransferase [Saonia flava]|uniref:Ribosomal-protein-alanine N-acetyltransferase n=1 Tax=Saonia flava TaxID=523696 RepID=A0A846R5I9_9FLAO|nr:GNAT family N-acetyltransferase [Saonia flava]NJB72644.1 ribosomal-protein-alanine N-acetyltransferase [Saonia flava]